MEVMVASQEYFDSLCAFSFGYARLDVKKQGKKIFSMFPLPFFPLFFLSIIIAVLLWFLLNKKKIKEEIEIESYLTKRNEGILISEEDAPGLLNGKKEDLAKLLGIAIDKTVIEQGVTPNHVFFLLNKDDFDIFSDEVLETIADKQVWLFLEDSGQAKLMKKFERIGKVILFDSEYMQTCGYPKLILGIIPRFLSLISRDSNTTLDHIFHGIPDKCTISFSFPTDVHSSLASVLKHQKYFCANHNDSCLQITNRKDYVKDIMGPAKYVKSETESFFVSFREVA